MLDRETIYERWLGFSLRLADTLQVTPARKEKIKNKIENFIHMYEYPAYKDKPILGQDEAPNGWLSIGSHADEYFSDYEVWNRKREEYTGKFSNQVRSCIRAGLDVAVPDMCGGGVLGFTIGTIRKMFKDNVPDWLNEVLELEGNEPANTPIWLQTREVEMIFEFWWETGGTGLRFLAEIKASKELVEEMVRDYNTTNPVVLEAIMFADHDVCK